MKKVLLFLTAIVLLTTASCRVTKSITMMTAKNRAAMTEVNFLTGKEAAVSFLRLSEDQLKLAVEVWKTEKKSLSDTKLENEKIAPIIYTSEIDFRKILSDKKTNDEK